MVQKPTPSSQNQFIYIANILLNSFLIYAANNLLDWKVPYLTQEFTRCLPALILSLSVSIFCNVVFLVYSPKWFRHLMQAIMNCFAWYFLLIFFQVMPLEIPAGIPQILRVGFIFLLIMIPIGTITELVQAFQKLYKQIGYS